MPFVLVLVGILMIVTGAQGTYRQFGAQVASDFTGKGNFVYWVASIGIVGAVGYIKSLETISRMLMALIIISMVLSNRGFFAKFAQAIKQGPKAPQPGLSLGGGAVNSNVNAPNEATTSGVLQGSVPSWLSKMLGGS